MGSLGPTAVSRRFPADPASAAAARDFVLGALPGTASHLVDTARLPAGEPATNAVLHARSEFEVAVRRHDGRVRVRVTDRRPDRGPVPQACPAYAGTGQGPALVEQPASRYGADTDGEHRAVWFELWSDGPPPPVSGWEPAVSPCASERTVTLIDVPAAPGLRRRCPGPGVALPSARRCRLCPFGQRLVPSRLLTLRQGAVSLPLVSITSRRAAR
ncbi:ATP-binding protein [Streptomyces olivaceus]|uniref:ATP-binding protein n=1 Tax=Streptomyces olivaceus TaxID=47716 RepID=UPI003556500D